MTISGPSTAHEFLAAWDGKPRRGILIETIAGLHRSLALMQDVRKFTDDQRSDMQIAIQILESKVVSIERCAECHPIALCDRHVKKDRSP